MRVRLVGALCSSLALAMPLVCSSVARSQEAVPPPPPNNNPSTQPQPAADQGAQPPTVAQPATDQSVQPLASGPVHEAFAQPSVRGPVATPVVPKQPPDPIQEVPPDQKPADETAIWIPGYWAWGADTQDFIWVSGIWRVPPPGFQWVPGYWTQAEGGWQWVPGFWQQANTTELSYLPAPPDPINEAISPAPDDNSFYVPGCWMWQTSRYMWRPGFWLGYQPGWLWQPASYFWTPSGYVFVNGYWDRPFRQRGLLFAPVLLTRAVFARPGWTYTPSYVVNDEFLLSAMFVRPATMMYYFGDFFGRRYRDRGFIPWLDFRIGRNVLSPLLAYYAWTNRGDRTWYRDLNALYVGRERGLIAPPPRTFAQQQTVINRITNNVTVNNVTINKNRLVQSATALTTLQQVNKTVRLTKVPPQQLTAIRTHAKQLRQVSTQRTTLEKRLATTTQATTQQARVARLTLPRSPVAASATHAVRAPAMPRQPRPQALPAQTTHRANTLPAQPRTRPTQENTVPGRERTTTPSQPRTLPSEPRTQPERRPPATQPRPQPKPEQRPPATQPRPQPRPEQRPPASQPRPQPKPEQRPPASQPRPQPKPEQRPPATQQHPQPRPQPAQERRQPEPQPRKQPMPERRPQPPQTHETRPAPQPRAEPSRPAPKPHAPESRPAPRPQHENRPAPQQHQPAKEKDNRDHKK